MAFVKREIKDRVVQYPRRYQLVEVQPGIFDLIPVTGTVTEEGTPVNKELLQRYEDGISDLDADVVAHKADYTQYKSTVNLEFINMQMQLDEANIMSFVNKTGVGFYDLFDTTDNIDAVNTTATVDTSATEVTFAGSQILKMLPQTFDTFVNIDLNLYATPQKATIKGDVNNSTTVVTGATDRELAMGDKLFIDGAENEIIAVEEFTPHEVVDATVVASAYDTSGNGGRKLVRLENGNLFAVVKEEGTNNVRFYVSKDNSATWVAFGFYNLGSTSKDASLVPLNEGYVGILATNAIFGVTFYKVDTSEAPVDQSLSLYSSFSYTHIDTGQSALGNVSLAINEAGDTLHAAWSSKNSIYPDSFNIRYAKGTINEDGSVTWGAVEQLSTVNGAGLNVVNPSITLNASDVPVVVAENQGEGSKNSILVYVRDGSPWDSKNGYDGIYSSPTSYTQSSPSVIFVPQSINGLPQGRIWVAWHGRDDVDTSVDNIRCKYSDDGGITWVNANGDTEKLTSGNTGLKWKATLTANKDNTITILFQDSTDGINNIYKIVNTSDSWGLPIQITDVASTHDANDPSSLFDATFSLDFSEPLFIYSLVSGSKVGFYGTWTEGEGYTLTMTDPVTLTDGQQVPIVDFGVKQGASAMVLENIDAEKYNFSITGLNTDIADITVNGKDTTLKNIAYAIS